MPKQTWWNLDEAKRQQIEQEAMTEFAQFTYSQASVTSMVRKLHIAKGSIYQYFTDKEDLYITMVRLAHERVMYALRSRIPPVLYREGDIFALLRRYFAESVGVALDFPVETTLIQRSLTDTGPAAPTVHALAMHIQRTFVDEIVSSAVESKSLRSDIDKTVTMFILESLLERMIPYIQRSVASDTQVNEESVRASAGQIVLFFDQLIAVLSGGLRSPATENEK
jgi:AcrR family transcriptional regulator